MYLFKLKIKGYNETRGHRILGHMFIFEKIFEYNFIHTRHINAFYIIKTSLKKIKQWTNNIYFFVWILELGADLDIQTWGTVGDRGRSARDKKKSYLKLKMYFF